MHLIDEMFWEMRRVGHFETLASTPIESRWKSLQEIVRKLNIFKREMSDLTPDEELYLTFLIQKKGVDMGLNPNFYIFFSRRNGKFHHACLANDKKQTNCGGEKGLCSQQCLNNLQARLQQSITGK